MPTTLAQSVRAKYPGVYDDLSDAALEAKVTAKYPGVYDDLPKTTTTAPPSAVDTAVTAAKDLAGGVRAGVANTLYGGGDLIRRATGMPRIVDQPTVKAAMTPPASVAGKIGYGGEQVGEFLLPTGIVGKAGKVAEAAKAVGLTMAQGGSPALAGVSGALAAIPGGALAEKAAGGLETSAEKTMAQALGATKEWAKAEASKLAPQMLERGVSGSRPAMLTLAKTQAARIGTELNAAYDAAAKAGASVPSAVVQGYLQLSADALKIPDATGALRIIPGTEKAVQTLTDLGDFVTSLGADIPVDKAATIKRTWDQIVSKAGLFGPKAMASASDNAEAWAIREASGQFRTILNADPTIAQLNQESAFWTGLKNVLKETEKRTQSQRGGITDAIRGAGGAALGAATGGPAGAAVGQFVTEHLSKILNSPAWKTTIAAPAKQALADALASGSSGRILSTVQRLSASLPAQLHQALAP